MCSYNSGCVVNHIHLPAASRSRALSVESHRSSRPNQCDAQTVSGRRSRRIPLAVTATAGLDRVALREDTGRRSPLSRQRRFHRRGFTGILKRAEGKHPYQQSIRDTCRSVYGLLLTGHAGCGSFVCSIRIEWPKRVPATESGRLAAVSDDRGPSGNVSRSPARTRPRGSAFCRTRDADVMLSTDLW